MELSKTIAVVLLSLFIFLISDTGVLAQETFRDRVRARMQERARERNQAPRSAGVNDSGDPQYTLSYGGQVRSYLVHVPKGYDGKTVLPLVFVFHGGGGNAQNAVRMTSMDDKADRENFIAVYPNGTGRYGNILLTWNTWRCCGQALDRNVDDVGFIRALFHQLQHDYKIDANRVFGTGISNGGMLSYRLACELSDIFAAVAPVAGALDTDNCKPATPVSLIIFHGTADKHILYDGGKSQAQFDQTHAGRVDNPVSFAVQSWVRIDRCNPHAEHSVTGNVIHDIYSGGLNGTAVELYTIKGGGHCWPGGKPGLRFGNPDMPTTEISATDLMWDFFQRHPKPSSR